MLNTGLVYNLPNAKSLPAGQLYLGLYHGRKDPNADMDDFGTEGNIFGPYDRVKIVNQNDISLTDTEGAMHKLTVFEDMILMDGIYYGDWCFFINPVDALPRMTHNSAPIACYPYDGGIPEDLSQGLYIDAQKTNPDAGVLHKRALIGPLYKVIVTYLHNFKAENNSPAGFIQLFKEDFEKFDTLEIFVGV